MGVPVKFKKANSPKFRSALRTGVLSHVRSIGFALQRMLCISWSNMFSIDSIKSRAEWSSFVRDVADQLVDSWIILEVCEKRSCHET